MPDQFDLIVIGAGPAGALGAAQAAALGKRVALVEREPYLGGAGLSTGTMPSKMLREAAVMLAALRQRGPSMLQFALAPNTRLSDLMYNKDVVIEAAWGVIQRNCERQNIRIVRGTAAFRDARTVIVTGLTEAGPAEEELMGGAILVATGSTSIHPALFPFDHPQVRDAESVLTLEYLPKSIAIIGGGTIGCEYASICNALGVRVTVVEARQRVLASVDAELAARWQKHLAQQGVQFLLGNSVTQVQTPKPGQTGEVRLALEHGPELAAEVVLVAVGRYGQAAGLNLEAAGLAANDKGNIAVNEHYQTRVAHIYAAGDIVGWPALASTSMEQARVAVAHAFHQPDSAGQAIHPVAVYTIPEVGMVGLSEDACRQQNIAYSVGRADFVNNPHAQISGDTSGMLKLIFAPADQRLLGVHLMCAGASDLIHLGAHVLASGGTLEAFTQVVYNYPTLSEAYKAAALDGLAALQRSEAAEKLG
ncbi:MAG: Si-specific NAD(P)(+) transhydrogenase [Anaerolineales bacterium]